MFDARHACGDHCAGSDLVVAVGIGFLIDRVAEAVDDIDVVSGAALHGIVADTASQCVVAKATRQVVIARTTIESIVASVAGDRVVERVAGAVEVGSARQCQVIDIRQGSEAPGEPTLHRVDAATQCVGDALRHHIRKAVDNICVVALAADQRVVSKAAIQAVGQITPGEDVVEGVAGKPGGIPVADNHVLDIGSEGIEKLGLNFYRISTFVKLLNDRVRVIDDVVIATGAARQDVGAEPTRQLV